MYFVSLESVFLKLRNDSSLVMLNYRDKKLRHLREQTLTTEIQGRPPSSSRKRIEFGYGDSIVDWEKAAPSWSAIFVGAILPIAGALVIALGLCVALYSVA